MFVPSSNVLKVILNSAVTLTGRYWAGCFIAKHTGCIMMQVTGYSCNEGYKGGIHIYPGSTLRHETSVAIYPSMPPIYDNTATGDEYPMTFTSINTPQTYTLYMQVQAGEIYYFCPRAFSATYPSVCTNITLYGSTISYF